MAIAHSILLAAFGIALGASPALAQPSGAPSGAKGAAKTEGSSSSKISSGDRKLMEKMARAGHAEVATGKVAADKGQDPQVRKFAQHMIDEHGKGNQELEQIAQSKGVKLPGAPDSDHRDKLADLRKLSGEKFDKKYIEQAGVKDHKAALKLFKDAAEDAKDPELKRFAQKEVDHIQEHLQMAQRIADTKK